MQEMYWHSTAAKLFSNILQLNSNVNIDFKNDDIQ